MKTNAKVYVMKGADGRHEDTLAGKKEVRQQCAVDLTNLLFDPELPEGARKQTLKLIDWLSQSK